MNTLNISPEIYKIFDSISEEQKIIIISMIEKIIIEQTQVEKDSFSKTEESKWAKYAKTAPATLTGIGDYVLEQSKEFRKDFIFKHDL